MLERWREMEAFFSQTSGVGDGIWKTPRLIGGNPPSVSRRGYRGPGTTMAQQKRASRKAKNVKRHKARARR